MARWLQVTLVSACVGRVLGLLVNISNFEPANPDEVARSNFVDRCKVIFEVSQKKYLPMDALNKFCSETKHVVECRMNLVTRLERTHDRGESMDSFCLAVYEWFQQKYGNFCPEQCNKHQCKATCAWLREKNDLSERKKVIEDRKAAQVKVDADVKKLQAVLEELKREQTMLERVRDQSKVNQMRANTDNEEANKAAQAGQAELQRLSAAASTKATLLKERQAAVSAVESQMQANRFEMDRTKLDYDKLLADEKRIESQVNESSLRLESENAYISKLEQEQATYVSARNEALKREQEAQKSVDEQLKVVEALSSKVTAAENALQASKEKGDSKDSVDVFEASLSEQKLLQERASEVLSNMEHGQREFKAEADRAAGEVERLQTEMAPLRTKTQIIASDVNKSKEELQRIHDSAEGLRTGDLSRLETERKAAAEQLEVERKQVAIAAKTSEFAEAAVIEQKKTIKDLEDTVARSAQAAADAEAAFKKAFEKAGELASLVTEKSAEFEIVKGEADKAAQEIASLENEQKANTRALEDRKPEIVSQHGLGFLAPVFAAY